MSNLFVNLPLPVMNGPGAAVSTAGMGIPKTITVAGDFAGAVIAVEGSVDGGVVYAPILTFQTGETEEVIEVVCDLMRVTVSGRKNTVPFSAVVGVSAPGVAGQFASLPMPIMNGPGAAVDISAFGVFTTFIVGGALAGATVLVEISENGVDYVPLVQFSGNAGINSFNVTSAWARINVSGRKNTIPFTATAALGAVDQSGGGSPLTVEDEGVVVTFPTTVINFVGAGVTVTDVAGVATVAVPGGAGAVTAQQTALVDPTFGVDATGAFGNLSLPYKTIQAALNDIPTPAVGNAAGNRTVWTILVSPGTYDEDLAVDLTRKRIILASWGPWNLGTFAGASWAPSGTLRNITITTTDNLPDASFIHPSFSIQPMLPAGTGDNTQSAYANVPRISGKIDLSGVIAGSPSIDLTLECVVFGVAGASLVGGTTDVASYIRNARMRGTVVGSGWVLQSSEQTRFDVLVDVLAYGRLQQCYLGAGMTVAGVVSGSLPIGFYDCEIHGTFTGPAASLWIDQVTNYWFKTNACVLAGGATKTIIEIVHPMALPEQWAVQNVPANTAATAMSAQVSTNFDTIKAMRDGSIVGISARLTEAVTAGLLQIDATINGVIVPGAVLSVSMVPPSTGGQTIAAVGVAPYAAGDLIGIKFTSDAGFTPITTDLEAWLEVVEEIP